MNNVQTVTLKNLIKKDEFNLTEQISSNKETEAGSGIFLLTSPPSQFITQTNQLLKAFQKILHIYYIRSTF